MLQRLRAIRLKLNKEIFDVQELLTVIINEYSKIIEKSNKNIKLVYTPKKEQHKSSILIQGDKGRISQVVFNLFNNALKFTEEGSIVITSEIKDDHNVIVVSINDSGAGIDPEIISDIYQVCNQISAGTGLGLYISKIIVEAHGGRIWAQNNPDGKGATFSFSLPLD